MASSQRKIDPPYGHLSMRRSHLNGFRPNGNPFERQLKCLLPTDLGEVEDKRFDRYLAEFFYRFDRRFWEYQMFARILAACVVTNTVSYRALPQSLRHKNEALTRHSRIFHSFSQSSTSTPDVSLGWIKAIRAPPAPFRGS